MAKLTFSNLSKADLKRLVNLQEKPAQSSYSWLQVEGMVLTEVERQRLQFIQSDLVNLQVHLLNEPTLWARAIYPLLLLAERDSIRAWAGVPLYARYAQFEIEGVADGVLGKSATGFVEAPFRGFVEAPFRGCGNETGGRKPKSAIPIVWSTVSRRLVKLGNRGVAVTRSVWVLHHCGCMDVCPGGSGRD